MATKRRLTKKQQGFLKDYEATGNAVQAAMKNYDVTSYGSAGQIGYENLRKLEIQKTLNKDAQAQEMDRAYIMRRLKDHADQDIERMASLKALELTAKIIRLLNDNPPANREDLSGDIESRTEEAARSISTLAQCLTESGGRFALFIESGGTGVRSHNGTSAQGNYGIHPNVEQT